MCVVVVVVVVRGVAGCQLLSPTCQTLHRRMDIRSMIVENLDPLRKRCGGLRTKQAGRGSCRGS